MITHAPQTITVHATHIAMLDPVQEVVVEIMEEATMVVAEATVAPVMVLFQRINPRQNPMTGPAMANTQVCLKQRWRHAYIRNHPWEQWRRLHGG